MSLFYQIFTIPYFSILNVSIPSNHIPSFIFHNARADEFEELLSYLKTNGYKTLGINEYCDYLLGKRSDNDRKVILTFDDGLRSIWSVGFPLLKKFNMKAVYYISPGVVSQGGGLGLSLEDVWFGKLTMEELEKIEKKDKYISWDEARKMEGSGLVDIESHSWEHKSCFVEGNIIDFQHPTDSGEPFYRWLYTAMDVKPNESTWGAPVYPFRSRLIANRFFDDAGLRSACIDYVRRFGAEEFFAQRDWRVKLYNLVADYKKSHALHTCFESDIEQELAIRESLEKAKIKIENELNKSCEHFAYPWNSSGKLSLLWLKELGFKSAFCFLNSMRVPQEGDDLFCLSRIEGCWMKSLPGKGRVNIWNKLGHKIIRIFTYSNY